jgi:hypothetical protein
MADEQDIKAAFAVAHREWWRLRKEALSAYDAALRADYGRPVMGTIMLSDALRLGSLVPRDHWKAGTLRPLTRQTGDPTNDKRETKGARR